MGDVLLQFLRTSLPDELAAVLQDILKAAETADLLTFNQLPDVQILLGHQDNDATKDAKRENFKSWSDYIFHRLGLLFPFRTEEEGTPIKETLQYRVHLFWALAVAALNAFVQSNITGPPLAYKPSELLFTKDVSGDAASVRKIQQDLIASLSLDGIAAYKLTPNIELLCLADTILINPIFQKFIPLSTWARLRTSFTYQRLLSEPAPSLQTTIYDDLKDVEKLVMDSGKEVEIPDLRSTFLLERAAVHTHHGLDKQARADLDQATAERKFEFALTGLMGKRTKFQQKDTSQLLVLAKSAGTNSKATSTEAAGPKALDLNDDTLHETIQFTKKVASMDIQDESKLPASLASLEPANQPLLEPLDSVILLSLAEQAVGKVQRVVEQTQAPSP